MWEPVGDSYTLVTNDMVNKKIVAGVSLILTLLFVSLNYIGTFQLCGGKVYGSCMESLHSFFTIFVPILPFFLFALITYFLPEKVYQLWLKFALPALALSMILIAMTTDTPAPAGFGGPGWGYGKGDVALYTSALFVLVSICVIVGAWLAYREK